MPDRRDPSRVPIRVRPRSLPEDDAARICAAGGQQTCILFHDSGRSRESLLALERGGRGPPARVIPLEVHDAACVGLDLMLACIEYGASKWAVLVRADTPRTCVQATGLQVDIGNTILAALGYGGHRLNLLLDDGEAAPAGLLWAMPCAEQPGRLRCSAFWGASAQAWNSCSTMSDAMRRGLPT